MIGQCIADLTHPLDRLALTRMLETARGGSVPTRQEMRFQRPGQSDVTTGFSVAPGEEGDSAYTVCVIRDLSSEKVLRPQLLHTERMASMGLVASVIAHELNNALAGAIGCLELIQPQIDGEETELFETALQELQRSAEIVSDIKGYARTEEGMNERVQIPDLVASLERLHRYHAGRDRSSSMSVAVSGDLPDLEGNKNQLLQAVLNLVRNADDAVQELPLRRQHVEIKITQANDIVCISVIDRGPGIPENQRGRLFDPFFSTKAAGSGTGLGLTVVQSVAAGHGGRVEVLDTPGGGATFQLLLPVPASVIPAIAEESQSTNEPAASPLAGARILVADDEQAIRRILRRVGAGVGAEMVIVGSAGSAIEALKEHEFDLVLLDVRMSGGGGPAVFRYLEEHAINLVPRTIFMTGEPSLQMNTVRGGGYYAILNKPFRIAQLKDMMTRALLGEDK